MNSLQTLLKGTRTRYLLAVALIAVAIIFSYALMESLLDTHDKSAKIINIAGSQRMLSQKITLLVNLHSEAINKGTGIEQTSAELIKTATKMLQNHHLLKRDSSYISDASSVSLAALDARVESFTHRAMAFAKLTTPQQIDEFDITEFVYGNSQKLLNDLDKHVTYQESITTEQFQKVRVFEIITLLLILLFLLLIVFFIFKPIEKLIEKSFKQHQLAERKVFENNERMKIAARTAGIGVWEYDLSSNEMVWDEQMIYLYGLDGESFNGAYEAWSEGVHADDYERAQTELDLAIAGKQKFDTDFRVVTPSGDIRHIKAAAEVLTDAKQNPAKIIGINYDITETKLANQAIDEINQRMQVAANSAGIGVWELDLIKNELTWDDWMIRLYGLEREDFIGAYQAWENGVHPDDLEMAATELQKAIRGESKFEPEFRVVWPNEEVRYIQASAVVINDSSGNPIRMIGVNYDITERKAAANELIESNQKMKLAADSAGIGVWELDLVTNELTWDDWMFRIFAIDPEQFSGAYEAWANCVHPDDLPNAVKELEAAIRGDKKLDNEFRILWPNDEVRYIKVAAQVEYDPSGKPVHMTGINYDVTQFKETEVALTLAKEQAEAAVIAKSEFLASMSHEIRTPMNGVLGMLGLLLNTPLNEEQKHRTMVAQSSARSLLALINDILDFSKIEADKLDLELINFDLRRMLGEFAEGMAQQAQAKGLELILDMVGVRQSNVVGDPGRIRQIATNLVGNAIKFTQRGEVLISAGLVPIDDENWRFEFSVRDTGIGISEQKVAHLFDAFSQVDASTTRKYGGTGLGLAIVKKLSELMGGEVAVESELDKGSLFKCYIQLGKAEQSQTVLPRVDMSNLNLLVVDDNQTNREVLAKQMQHWGAKVTEASSAQEAISLCGKLYEKDNKSAFDIALLDMQMPGMDGAELGSFFSNDSRFKSMKLVMMTSMSFHGDAKRMADLGFSAYFPKPATTGDLFKALSVVAEGGEALEAAQPLVTRHYLKSLAHNQMALSEDQISEYKTLKWLSSSKILLVEDNHTNQLVALDILKDAGLQARIANNGQEAIDCLANESSDKPFVCVIMDCQMPVLDGYKATQNIRAGKASEKYRDIPIIAMTANAMQGDKEKCLRVGMNDYLSKPIDPEQLLAKLLFWIVDEPASRGASERPQENRAENKQEGDMQQDDIHEEDKQALCDWDQDDVLNRLRGKTALLSRLVEVFLKEHPERMASLKQAVENGDSEAVVQYAHSVKGVAANLSAKRLQHLSGEMELAAREQDSQRFIELLPKTLSASQKFIDIIKNFSTEDDTQSSAQTKILSNDVLIEQLQQLKGKLEASMYIDSDGLTYLTTATDDPQIQLQLKNLVEQVGRLDFESGVQTIDVVARQLSS